MAFNVNPFSWKAFNLSASDAMRQWQAQVADFCTQVQLLFSPTGIGSFLNAQNLLLATSLLNSLTDLGSPGGNSTIDTKQAAVIAVRINWTVASNWTLTLNNLAPGALVLLRLVNSSGGARTFTVTANTPASVAYVVQIFIPALTTLSSGTSINNATGINGIGISSLQGGAPLLYLIGSIG